MNTTKFLTAGIAGGITFFLLGWLIFGMLLMDFFNNNNGGAAGVMRADDAMVWWALIAGNLCYGLMLSYIFNKWAGIKTFGAGVSAGAVIAFLVAASFDLSMYGTSYLMNLKGSLVDIVSMTVIGAIVGGVVGMVSGMGKPAA